jgi:hypothetical protein
MPAATPVCPMAIITCAIIDLVAIALFLGLCARVCP